MEVILPAVHRGAGAVRTELGALRKVRYGKDSELGFGYWRHQSAWGKESLRRGASNQ